MPARALQQAGREMPQVRSLSGNRFVVGPILLQRLSVAFGLTAIEIRLLLECLRLGVESTQPADLALELATAVGIPVDRIPTVLARLVPRFADPDASDPLDFALPFLREIKASSGMWYGPHVAPAGAPARPPRTLTVADTSRRPDLLVVTGFLGSGKTTLINQLLLAPEMAASLIVVNEAGEAAVDHLVVQQLSAPQDLLLLRNGCLCCAFGEALSDTLCKLVERRNNGQGPYFDRLLVETSGIADPIALIHALQQDRKLRDLITYRGVCTTVDSVAVEADALLLPEASRQLDAADWIVMTKIDLVDREIQQELVTRVGSRSPAARVFVNGRQSIVGDLVRSMLEDAAARSFEHSTAKAVRWRAEHDSELTVTTIRRDRVDDRNVRLFLDLFALAKGDELYRMKGILALVDAEKPLLFQAVRANFHELLELNQEATDSRLTVIGRRIDSSRANRLLDLIEHL